MADEQYPRLRIYKVLPECEHQPGPQLPWRVQTVRWAGDEAGFVEFHSRTVQSCWAHAAYKLGPKMPRQRLTKTLNKH